MLPIPARAVAVEGRGWLINLKRAGGPFTLYASLPWVRTVVAWVRPGVRVFAVTLHVPRLSKPVIAFALNEVATEDGAGATSASELGSAGVSWPAAE